jgi:1-acyl-sn-glycerol-3-phosphate acyltransferase
MARIKPYAIVPFLLQKGVWIPTRIILRFFVKLKVEGLENLENINENVIFASNHTSELDPILLPASLNFFSTHSPIFYTSRSKGQYNGGFFKKIIYGGYFFKMWGAYPLYIGLYDYYKSMINHINIINDGFSVLIFPEGKITKNGQMGEGRGGTVFISNFTKKNIVPMKITGAFQINLKDFLLRKKLVIVKFGKPINFFPNNILEVDNFDYKVETARLINTISSL